MLQSLVRPLIIDRADQRVDRVGPVHELQHAGVGGHVDVFEDIRAQRQRAIQAHVATTLGEKLLCHIVEDPYTLHILPKFTRLIGGVVERLRWFDFAQLIAFGVQLEQLDVPGRRCDCFQDVRRRG